MRSPIYLTRHGRTYNNELDLGLIKELPLDEDPDDLSLFGVRQADILGRYLAQELDGAPVTFLTSTASRSIDTAVIIADSFGIKVDPLIAWKRPDFWCFEDLRESLVTEYHARTYPRLRNSMKTQAEAHALVRDAILSRTETPKNLVAVLHLNIIRAFMETAFPKFPFTQSHWRDNCGLYLLERDGDKLRFVDYSSNKELEDCVKQTLST